MTGTSDIARGAVARVLAADSARLPDPWECGPPPGRYDDEAGRDDDRVAHVVVADEAPTYEQPFRGLDALAKVAVLGAARIRELASAPVPFVWTDIAVAGTIAAFAGGPGEGKTTLLFLLLAARLNLGAPVALLGREVRPAPVGRYVVLIEGEHAEGSASRKLISSCETLGIEDSCLDRLILVARKAVRLGSPEWQNVVTLIRAGLVSDIALDTMARVAPADANDEREQVAIFDIVAQALEAAPGDDGDKPVAWCVMHTRKGGNGELADVSGSAQRTGQADTVLLVKGERVDGRVVSSTVTFAKLREEPDDYPSPATFAIKRSASGARTMAEAESKTNDGRPIEARVLNRLALGPRTKSMLARELARSKADVDEALSNLFAAKAIESTSIKVKGREWKAFARRSGGRSSKWDVIQDEPASRDDMGRDGTDS